jgi:DNA transposition AAA+ family ATPase
MKGKPLTEELKAQIVAEFNDSGETMKNIAAKFNLSMSAVGKTLSDHYASKHPAHDKEFEEWIEEIEKQADKVNKAFASISSIFKRR